MPHFKAKFATRIDLFRTGRRRNSNHTTEDLLAHNKIKNMSARPTPNRYDVIAIGSSTGGPNALIQILPKICEHHQLPILISQHMPADFTKSFANSLMQICKRKCVEAGDGMTVSDNTIYLAPGANMKIRTNQEHEVKLFILQRQERMMISLLL